MTMVPERSDNDWKKRTYEISQTRYQTTWKKKSQTMKFNVSELIPTVSILARDGYIQSR